MRRLISGGAGLIFKGNGFYVTDYKRSNLPDRKKAKGTHLKKPDAEPKVPAKKPKESKD